MPGSTTEYKVQPYEYQRPGQPLVVSYPSTLRYARTRSENTSKPVALIPGTNTPWRKASSFSRAITWYFDERTNWSVYYGPSRTDTYSAGSQVFVGNTPYMNEFLPMFPSGGYQVPEYDQNDRNRAITECLLKIGEQKANISESLATARQTVDMIAQNAARLWGALLAAKRGQWGAIPKKLGLSGGRGSPGFSGYWLEWQYGWRPLCSDIHTLMDSFQKRPPEALLIRARRTIGGSRSYSASGNAGSGYGYRPINWDTKSKYSTTCSLTGRVSDKVLHGSNQLGLINPLSLAWELVPWSFVVDWSIPVGNFLSALTATAGLDFVDGYTSCRIQGDKIARIGREVYVTTNSSNTQFRTARFGFRRDALTGWPLPLLYVKSPFSSTHTANALALLAQLRK